jgi:hypothetical protein
MVKKFRRAAAGIEEQLPSDLRTPKVLSQTCDYLFNELIGNASELGRVHNFVWDRTRAIRNDFTILQVSSPDQLSHAVDCLERIARFHILSLHQLAGVKEKDFQYDWQQDREQLDRTLVSLIQYYDDSRGKIALPNATGPGHGGSSTELASRNCSTPTNPESNEIVRCFRRHIKPTRPATAACDSTYRPAKLALFLESCGIQTDLLSDGLCRRNQLQHCPTCGFTSTDEIGQPKSDRGLFGRGAVQHA